MLPNLALSEIFSYVVSGEKLFNNNFNYLIINILCNILFNSSAFGMDSAISPISYQNESIKNFGVIRMNAVQQTLSAVTITASEQYSGFANALERLINGEVNFGNGLTAFEDIKTFTYKKEVRLKPFIYMHSTVNPNISFVCVDPFILTPSYRVTLTEETLVRLDIQDKNDILVLCLVSVGKDMYTTTANLMAPLVINTKMMKGEQVILEDIKPEFIRYNVWTSIGQTNFNVKKAN